MFRIINVFINDFANFSVKTALTVQIGCNTGEGSCQFSFGLFTQFFPFRVDYSKMFEDVALIGVPSNKCFYSVQNLKNDGLKN